MPRLNELQQIWRYRTLRSSWIIFNFISNFQCAPSTIQSDLVPLRNGKINSWPSKNRQTGFNNQSSESTHTTPTLQRSDYDGYLHGTCHPWNTSHLCSDYSAATAQRSPLCKLFASCVTLTAKRRQQRQQEVIRNLVASMIWGSFGY